MKPNPARTGHIATAIRGYMQREGLNAAAFMQRLETGLSASIVSLWVANKSCPNPEIRAKLATLLGVEAATLEPHDTARRPGPGRPPQHLGPARQAVIMAQADPPRGVPAVTTEPVRDIFSITARSDGQMSVRLNVTLDAAKGMALGRMLFDFGLIIGDG